MNWSLTKEQRQYNETKIDFSTNSAETTGHSHAKNLVDLGCGDAYLDITLKTQFIKETVKLDFIKIKLLCEKTISGELEDKSQTERKYWQNKGLLSKIYKEHLKLNNRKTNNPMEKQTKNRP